MPYYLYDHLTLVQFRAHNRWKPWIRKAANKNGDPSSEAWLHRVVAEALHRELGLDMEDILKDRPIRKGERPPFNGQYGANSRHLQDHKV